MSKRRPTDTPKPPGPPTPDDLELWTRVTASVTPLKRAAGVNRGAAAGPVPDSRAAPATPDKSTPATPPRPKSRAAAAPLRQAPVKRDAPQFTGLDRRTSQKLTRGNADIDARIDLHGMTRENARAVLKNFLAASRSLGRRTVLVITGKGRSPYSSHTLHGYEQVDTPEREGVLRRALPQWLDETEFRVQVAGYQPAHPRHGGGGAFYIRLRKHKR